jgi:hypothetical protein
LLAILLRWGGIGVWRGGDKAGGVLGGVDGGRHGGAGLVLRGVVGLLRVLLGGVLLLGGRLALAGGVRVLLERGLLGGGSRPLARLLLLLPGLLPPLLGLVLVRRLVLGQAEGRRDGG